MRKFYAVGFAVSLIAVLALMRLLDLGPLMEAFGRVSLPMLLPCVGIYLLAHVLRVIRWKVMLRPLASVPFGSPLSALSICLLANNILPAHMGELVRAYLLAAENDISKSAVLGTVVMERVYDGLSVLFFLSILLLFLDLPDTPGAAGLSLSAETLRRVGVMGLAFFGGILLALRLLVSHQALALRLFGWLSRPLPGKLAANLVQMALNFASGLKIAGARDLAMTILLSLALWLVQCLWAYSPAPAFGLDIPVSAGFLMTVVLTFALLVPSAPAFIGTYQVAAILSLGCFGVDKNVAGAFSMVLWSAYLVTSSLLGLFFAWKTGLGWRSLRRGQLA
ncbi:MAG: flippase-like domain-containing protein [Deltaproteobacteria bacterium]|nr:flippase-like domain-containing protein [Deltaproteobacteria bacterium]